VTSAFGMCMLAASAWMAWRVDGVSWPATLTGVPGSAQLLLLDLAAERLPGNRLDSRGPGRRLPAARARSRYRRPAAPRGVPGLRFDGTAHGRIRLSHLPTGGHLELHQPRADPVQLQAQLHHETAARRHDQARTAPPPWHWEELADAEETALAGWALAPHACLLSAIMARIHVLWAHWPNGAELDVNPATGRPRLSWWGGPGTEELAFVLLTSAIQISGASWQHGPAHTITLTTGKAAVELRGPARCPMS
jgi:hypothetical protein